MVFLFFKLRNNNPRGNIMTKEEYVEQIKRVLLVPIYRTETYKDIDTIIEENKDYIDSCFEHGTEVEDCAFTIDKSLYHEEMSDYRED